MATKILFIITQSELGGAQRWVFDTTTHLDKNRYEAIVAAGNGQSLRAERSNLLTKLTNSSHSDPILDTREGSKKDSSVASLSQNDDRVKAISLHHLVRPINPIKDLLAIIEIYRLIKKERPDILQFCSTKAGILGSIAASLINSRPWVYKRKKPLVFYRIGGWAFNDPRPKWQNKIFLWLEKLTAPLKNKIIVNSQKGYDEALQYHICKKEKLVLIYNGINTSVIPEFSERKYPGSTIDSRLRGNDTVVGCIANNYPTKGLKYLTEAVNILKSEICNLQLIIVGTGTAIGPKDDPWEYFGSFANTQDDRNANGIDIFVIPSVKEGLPYVLLEAMAHGLPIIATTVGGIPEIIQDKQNGLLVPPKNSQALAAAIESLIKNPDLAQKLGQQAKEDVQQYSLEKMLEQIDVLYQK
ncbi:MAG: glycosyltransferase family 4 protein [Patescibacteria group bacterium]